MTDVVSRLVDQRAPATRLAALRIALGAFTTIYFVIRGPVFVELGTRASERFEPTGLVALLDGPVPAWVVSAALFATIAAGIGVVLGWRFRVTGPGFALGALLLTTYRSSWGQLLHFENLFVLLSIVVACSSAADAWSLDARTSQGGSDTSVPGTNADDRAVRYGWPLALCRVVVAVTYFVAGVAKLRYGGLDWLSADTLRSHIAYSAVRLDRLGGTPAPLAEVAVANAWLLGPFAVATVAIELFAPVVLVWRRARLPWAVATWAMHLGIFVTMFVGFPTPLFTIAFLPFFAIERPVERLVDAVGARRHSSVA